MVVVIAEIVSHCFQILFSILLVWFRSDLFFSLGITGYVRLHNQTSLHITLSKLVFTSHCIYFYYIVIDSVSSAYIPSVSFCFHDSDTLTFNLNRSLFQLYSFQCFFSSQILICSIPAAHMSLSPCTLKCVGC